MRKNLYIAKKEIFNMKRIEAIAMVGKGTILEISGQPDVNDISKVIARSLINQGEAEPEDFIKVSEEVAAWLNEEV